MKGVEMLVGNFEFNSGGLGGVWGSEKRASRRFKISRGWHLCTQQLHFNTKVACVVNVERRGKREGKSAKVKVPPEVRSASK